MTEAARSFVGAHVDASTPDQPAGTRQTPVTQTQKQTQALVARAVAAYDATAEDQPGTPPLPPAHELTQTQVLRLASALLKQVDVEVFELAMWQLWSRD